MNVLKQQENVLRNVKIVETADECAETAENVLRIVCIKCVETADECAETAEKCAEITKQVDV